MILEEIEPEPLEKINLPDVISSCNYNSMKYFILGENKTENNQLLKNIVSQLANEQKIDEIAFFSNSLVNITFPNLPMSLFRKYDIFILHVAIQHQQQAMKRNSSHTLALIFNDIVREEDCKNGTFEYVIANARFFNTHVIFITSFPLYLNKSLKSRFDYLFIFPGERKTGDYRKNAFNYYASDLSINYDTFIGYLDKLKRGEYLVNMRAYMLSFQKYHKKDNNIPLLFISQL